MEGERVDEPKVPARQRLGRIAARVVPLLLIGLLAGCGLADAPVINPKGPIALAERNLLFNAFWIMMIVAIPVYVLAIVFTLRYRANRHGNAAYTPDWEGSNAIEAVVWAIPAVIVIILGTLVWDKTHDLDPYKPVGTGDPFRVQVVAQDWKWLFIYPELGVATVNELAFPHDRPLALEITSDTVMNSLWIPALGGQIYAMAGMRSELHLLASEPGEFRGRNTMYSGDGFSDQHFTARALDEADFAAWRDKVVAADTALDARAYVELVKPSQKVPVTYYSSFEPNLFNIILRKYAPNPGPFESEAVAIICGGGAA
ncbi:MAG: ubiquinol oxidase subunit II [Acuticoccus sp.]